MEFFGTLIYLSIVIQRSKDKKEIENPNCLVIKKKPFQLKVSKSKCMLTLDKRQYYPQLTLINHTFFGFQIKNDVSPVGFEVNKLALSQFNSMTQLI